MELAGDGRVWESGVVMRHRDDSVSACGCGDVRAEARPARTTTQAATTPLLGGKGGHERLDDALAEVERSRLVVQKAFTTC